MMLDDDKTDDAVEETKDDDAGKDDDLIVDPFGKTDADGNVNKEDDDDKTDEVEEDDKEEVDDDEEEKTEKRGEIDFKAELDKVRDELGSLRETPKQEEKKTYTKTELRNFSRLVEQKYEDREITRAEFVAYKEQIEDYNEERVRSELKQENTREFSRSRAEENVNNWAQQNAPELLDGRTKRAKDAISFATQHLGAELKDGAWTVPENVGRILFSLASGAQDQTQEAEEKGRQKGLKEKAVRDRDLTAGDKPPGDKSSTGKRAKKGMTPVEKEVRDRLDLTPSQMKHYRRLRGNKSAEVIQ